MSHQDSLEIALLDYFKCSARAQVILPDLWEPEDDRFVLQAAYRLQKALETKQIPTVRDEADLEMLLSFVDQKLKLGTTRLFVSDECCAHGGWFEMHLNRKAQALSDIARPLYKLKAAWERVQAAMAADRALERIRS